MDGPELDEPEHPQRQPVAPAVTTDGTTRRHRLRSFISPSLSSGSNSNGNNSSGNNTTNSINDNSNSRPTPRSSDNNDVRSSLLHMQMPSLLRRLTSRRAPNPRPRPQAQSQSHHGLTEAPAPELPPVPSRRSLPFASLGRSATRRLSYIHQETVTTISGRQDQGHTDGSNIAYRPLEQDDNDHDNEDDGPDTEVTADELPRSSRRSPSHSQSHRRRLSLQMSNFFTNITSPGNRHAPSHPHLPRSRLSAHEPIAELDDLYLRPPTPAEVRMNSSQENVDDENESEYERGFTPRRRRLRPQPVVGEPHDEDYVRRRIESDRRARRATWGPTNHFSLRESSMESLEAASRPPVELPTPSTTSLSYEPRPVVTPSSRAPSIFSRAFSSSSNSDLPEPAHMPLPLPQSRQPQPPTSSPTMSRGANLLRQMLARRRNSNHADSPPSSTIPLAELQRLLASYAAQSSDRDYNGHQETTVDGGTITIYGIRRVHARANADSEDGGLFPPSSPSEPPSEERPPISRDRPRGPRRIFNFIGPGLNEIDPLPPEFEETFERLRRTRRPRSMFGSGSLRRNGVVEPDVSNTAGSSSQANDEPSQAPDSDETWIFYIVSAVLPEGHPLLSAPSLFTDSPTYEDMLFLDSFLQKPVASRTDLANARGLYRIHRRSNGDLYASGQEEVEDTIEITTERCLICLSDFDENEEARQLVKCTHFFHKDCIDTWLTEGRNSCPLCRGEGVEKKRSSRHMAAGPSTGPASPFNVL